MDINEVALISRTIKISVMTAVAFFLFASMSLASWAFAFVVNDGKMYVIADQAVDSGQLGQIVGKVTTYSDREGTYRGNFSNIFPEGTLYYEITGTDPNEAIAVEDRRENRFVKATYRGEYAGSQGAGIFQSFFTNRDPVKVSLALLITLIIVAVILILYQKQRRSVRK
ncbi:hypothetical protein ACE3MS_11475 [Paenibacillus dendritiformis]|uniref:hypothetical protein n=1 Tax=Paenibacillus dendritiformis TaxID=130049 RepID=UPI00366A2DFE